MPRSKYYKRHLPHWQVEGASYFITYVTKGALPESIAMLFRQAQEMEDRNEQEALEKEENYRRVYTAAFARLEAYLEQTPRAETFLLTSREAQDFILASLLWFAKQGKVRLLAACVMGNHVHIVIDQLLIDLENLLGRHKSFTAHQINDYLDRKGSVWHQESFDHMPRTQDKVLEMVLYTLLNPVKAGLSNCIANFTGSWWNRGVVCVEGNTVSWVDNCLTLPKGLHEL